MKRISFNGLAAVACACALASVPVCAQEAENDEKKDATAEASTEDAALLKTPKAAKVFQLLVRVKEINATTLEVMRPGETKWNGAEEGRYYPFGSAFRTVAAGEAKATGAAVLAFGPEATVTLTNAAEFATRAVALDDKTGARTLELRTGTVLVNLPRTLGVGLFSVVAPNFLCKDLAGNSEFTRTVDAEGDCAVVKTLSGAMALEGRHYKVARLAAADYVSIRTSTDALYTRLDGISGDLKVTLDQGLMRQHDFEADTDKDVAKNFDFALTPKCAIKIFRSRSAVGGRMSVSTMTFDPNGEMKNRFAFSEGRSNVNTGEQIVAPAPVVNDEKKDEKKDAAEGEGEEKPAAEASNENNENKTENTQE